MKTYQVEIKRTSYITVTVEADSVQEAEDKAWQELDQSRISDASWDIEAIEEMKS